nr:ATP-binding cassette domain-containing protein [Bacteroidales bacterium]
MSIVAEGVTKFYGKQKALDNVSFTIGTGEVVGFLGPNGAGKSTMMKIITGFIPASSGRVLVNGLDAADSNPEVRKKTGYLPENNPLYPEMYVKEYLSFVAALYKTGSQRTKHVENIIELTGLGPEKKKKIGSLSKGYRQRVGLAQALIHNPSVLILDEATTGLDPNQIVEIRNLIREAGREKTVMLSTHIMQEVEAICDRVIIIDHGVIMADEKKENIYSRMHSALQTIVIEFSGEVRREALMSLGTISEARLLRENTWELESSATGDIRPLLFDWAV